MLKLENAGYVDHKVVKDQSKKKTSYAIVHRADIEEVVSKITFSDWLILYYLAQSMDKGNFGELLQKLSTDIQEEYPYASDEEAAAMRPLTKHNGKFNNFFDYLCQHLIPLNYNFLQFF